ncbi:MAG: hypothetical protein KDC12_09665 [Flavobacteriales bacterium]|nr:hypothetical protein [Flavobacteriales bacterium]
MVYNVIPPGTSSDQVVDFPTTRQELIRMNEEVERLKAENQRLERELAERETAVQNLFSYIHGAGA